MAYELREGGSGGAVAAVAASAVATSPAFLGRRMIALAALANFLASGVTFGAFGNFLGPLSETFSVPRSTIGLGGSLIILAMGVTAPFVGRWLDAGRARAMMAGGAFATGIGLLLLAQANSLGQAAFAFVGLVCMGSAFFGTIPSMALATNWFERRRGLALGVTVAGATLSSYLAPALAQLLIDEHGWRTAVTAFGTTTLFVAVPLFGLFVIGRPEEIGQRPDGVGERSDEALAGSQVPNEVLAAAPDRAPSAVQHASLASSSGPATEIRELARDRRLWLLAIGFGLIMSSPVVLVGLLVEYGRDLGFGEQETVVFLAAMIPFSLFGKIVIGGLADVAPLKPSLALIVVVNMLVWLCLFLEPTYPWFLATGALYGLGIGGAAPVQGVAIARCFGRQRFGRANGIGAMAAIPLLAAASAFSHFLEGATGSYHAGFLVQIALLLLGGIAIALVDLSETDVDRKVDRNRATS